jgi:hypothetical protein
MHETGLAGMIVKRPETTRMSDQVNYKAFLGPMSSGAKLSSEASWLNSVTRAAQIWMRVELSC